MLRTLAWVVFFPMTISLSTALIRLKLAQNTLDVVDYSIVYGTISSLVGLSALFWFKYGVIRWLTDTFCQFTIRRTNDE